MFMFYLSVWIVLNSINVSGWLGRGRSKCKISLISEIIINMNKQRSAHNLELEFKWKNNLGFLTQDG